MNNADLNLVAITEAKGLDDISQVEQLARRIWTNHYTPIIGERQVEYMLEKIQSRTAIEKQQQAGMKYFLCCLDQQACGYLAMSIEAEDRLFLSKIYLDGEIRGKGIGRQCIEFVKSFAKQNNCTAVRLSVNKNNLDAQKAYERLGFVRTKEITQDIGGGFVMDDFEYVLQL